MNKKPEKQLFIFAGELSGDEIGADLIENMPSYNFFGVGGPAMRSKNLSCLIPMEEFQVMGFSAIIWSYPRLRRLFFQILNTILKENPPCVILIDYPTFNLKLAKKLRQHGYKGKIIQYGAPTAWAWKKYRVHTLADNFDLLLTLFPFEKEFFASAGIRTEYAGHPFVKDSTENPPRHSFPVNTLAIFPGSRKGEIAQNLPKQLIAAEQYFRKYPETSLQISISNPDYMMMAKEIAGSCSAPISFVSREASQDLMRQATLALATSGTVTLELALRNIPTVVSYNIPLFNWLLARYLFRINLPHYCIVNINLDDRAFPEIYGHNISTTDIFTALDSLHSSKKSRHECIEKCQLFNQLLTDKKSVKNAPEAIEELLNEH